MPLLRESDAGPRDCGGCRCRRVLASLARCCCLPARLAMASSKASISPTSIDWFKDARDASRQFGRLPHRRGFADGSKEVSREEILTTAGVTGRASLLFLDADAARDKLLANPWIGDAAVLKLYPDRLQITVTERQAFALWQKDGQVSVIASDGTVLEPFVEGRYIDAAAGGRQRRRTRRQGFSRGPRPLSGCPHPNARIDPGGGTALGFTAAQRHRRALAREPTSRGP